MKKLILLFLLAIPASAQVYQFTKPDCEFGFAYNVIAGVITSTNSTNAQRLPIIGDPRGGIIVGYDNRTKNCTSWTLTYDAQGVSALSIEADSAPSASFIPGSWSVWPAAQVAPGAALPLTSTTVGGASMFGYQSWVSVNLNSATGTGQVSGYMRGWVTAAGQDVASGFSQVQATGPTAVGTADTTSKPLLIGGINIAAGTNAVVKAAFDATGDLGVATATIDTDTVTNANGGRVTSGGLANGVQISVRPYWFNGTSWDRPRTSSADLSSKLGQIETAVGPYTFSNVNGASTGTAVKATAGILHSVSINTQVANATIRILNLASAGCTASPTTPTIALITLPATISNPFSQIYDVTASAGICVVTSGATDVTVSFE